MCTQIACQHSITPCKIIQFGFWNLELQDFEFLELESGFERLSFWIPQANISWFLESRLPYMGWTQQKQGFIKVVNKKAIGFHRQANIFELTSFIRKRRCNSLSH